MRNISSQDESVEEANLHVLRQAISEFEKAGCHVNPSGCLSVVEYEKHLSICNSFPVIVTAPNGIIEAELSFFRNSEPILLSIRVEKEWKSGFLSQIVLASQKKVGCVFHDKCSHQHALTAILGITVTSEIIPLLVKYVIDVDRESHEIRARVNGQDTAFANALKEREQESERAKNLMRKDIAILQSGIDEEARNYLNFIHEQEQKFETLLDNVLQGKESSAVDAST